MIYRVVTEAWPASNEGYETTVKGPKRLPVGTELRPITDFELPLGELQSTLTSLCVEYEHDRVFTEELYKRLLRAVHDLGKIINASNAQGNE